MKTKITLAVTQGAALLLLLLSTLSPQLSTAFAEGTTFTYQGRLMDGGASANGVYDLTFTLFDAANGGSAVGASNMVNDVGVTNGLFTVVLDPGVNVFTGAARWLSIAVRPGASAGAYTNLLPRQPIMPSPYAIYAGAVSAAGIIGTISSENIGAGSITTVMLADGAVGSNQLAAGAVTTTNLVDGVVTASKMATVPSSNWVALTTFTNPIPTVSDSFGWSVAAVGSDRVLMGALGGMRAAYLFSTNGMLLATFTSPNPESPDDFGHSVAAVGSDRMLVGAPLDNTGATQAGAAYLFSTNGTLLTTFTNPTPASFDFFGGAVAAVGSDRVLLGAPWDDPTPYLNAGAAYLFSTNGALLMTFTNPTPEDSDEFGWSVAAVGSDRVLIGAYRDDTGAFDAGAAYLFSTNGTLLMTFTNPTLADGDFFGKAVAAVGGGRVLIGAPQDDTVATDAGAAYLFSTNGTLLTTFTNPTLADGDFFGSSVAVVGSDRVLIGAYRDDTGAFNAGAAYLFITNGMLLTTFTNPTPADSDIFGRSVASVGSDGVLISAPVDTTVATNAGAAYLFRFAPSGYYYVSGLISAGVVDHSITAASFDNSLGAWSKSGARIFYNEGNVGIGTVTPTEKLSVAGNILATGTVSANTLAGGSITGNGAGLTALNASQLTSGTVADARIAATIARDSEVLPIVLAGDGAGSGLDADFLDGLSSAAFWKLGGNAGTTSGTHFLGTTDNQALEFKVNGQRALRLEDNGDSSADLDTLPEGAPNIIGGSPVNFVAPGVVGATISGGGTTNLDGVAFPNRVEGDFSTIGGGVGNRMWTTARFSTIAGGRFNDIYTNTVYCVIGGGSQNDIKANAYGATIAGGALNQIGTNSDSGAIGGGYANRIAAESPYASIAGGFVNDIGTNAYYSAIGGGTNNNIAANSPYATIGGGSLNNIGTNSAYATIPGGDRNFATNRAFAAGTRAKANHTGAFVWADSTDADFASTGANQFLVRAGGGMGVNVAQPLGKLHVGTSSNVPPLSLASHTIIIDNAAENGRAAFLALAGPGGSTATNRVELELEANEIQRIGIVGTTSNHEVQFRQNNTTRMRLATNGNIGIGESAPAGQLHVTGNTAAPQVHLEQTVNSDFARLRFNSGTKAHWDVAVGSGNNVMNFYSFGNGNVMTLTTNGTLTTIGPVNPPSDRNVKTAFEAVNARSILEKVAALPLMSWAYTNAPAIRHLGPVAQDFKAAFGVGTDDKHIATVDADGVALAAIQGLNQKLTEELKRRDTENAELKARLTVLEKLITDLGSKGN